MPLLSAAVTAAYVTATCLLAVFGAHRCGLLFRFSKRERRIPRIEGQSPPFVTVQIPMLNERTVAERVIRAAGSLDFPRNRFDIQVLDDSTDETRAIVDREVERLKQHGVSACVLRRSVRTGFKTGALSEGLRTAIVLCLFAAGLAWVGGLSLRHAIAARGIVIPEGSPVRRASTARARADLRS